ncbi:putative metalloprotease CJM1_0395 family protein [Lysinibacillus parviboronicapiens]|uniref:putative metalloprotease CJM1_0395 family protein n=1 Tax=Lysinibacillus parviboronicapiens TaxID=436516 RepID=UPI000D359966|nr:putative metalloprotease CJM1_0395 family protein [Lysinibacillus parviboronicapiens]
MKLSNLIQQESNTNSHTRKKILQRKEAGDAYRKNAQYFQPKKNPLLLELENLLLGHKDQDLYEQHKEEAKEVTPQQRAMISDLQQIEKNVRAHEQVYKAVGGDKTGTSPDTHATQPEGQRNISEEEVAITADKDTAIDDTFQNVEHVSSAALAPVNPSSQDLLVATSADAHLQQIQAKKHSIDEDDKEQLEENPAFIREIIEVKVPERFSKELKLDPFADTIFGKSYEEAFKARTFKNALAMYATHIQMAKNGYRAGNDSMFSMTA